jgi:TolB protein
MKKLSSIAICLLSTMASAIDLELTQGVNAAIPLAIEVQNPDLNSTEVASVVKHDFEFCGQFRLVNPNASFQSQAWDMWQRYGADHVVSLQITPMGGSRYAVSYQLKDMDLRGQVSRQQRFEVNANQMRALSHHIADEVYQQLTGSRGIFSTKLAYIKVQRSGQQSRYSLEVADLDGHNPRQLLMSSEPIMSPSWSPDGRQIAYVSFERRKPQIFQVSVETGQRRLITDFAGINGAPAWSPDGRQMAVVLSKSGSPKIYGVDLASGAMKQLTFGDSIDTEPRFTPDGRSIVFTSGRGGSPQIYRLSLGDGSISRLTYDGNYNARPSMTPNNQDLVVIHRQEDKSFNIGVQRLGSSQITTITHSSMDESPSVAPNGKMVAYASTLGHQGILGIASLDGAVQIRLPATDGDVQEPAWSPFLG